MANIYLTDNLRFLRELGGFTKQKDFANYLGFKVTTYNNYENGTSTPSILDLKIISEKYKITIDDLMFADLKENKTPPKPESDEGVPEIKKGSEPVSSDLFVRGLSLMLRELYVIQETQVWLAKRAHGIEESETVDKQDSFRIVQKKKVKEVDIEASLSK